MSVSDLLEPVDHIVEGLSYLIGQYRGRPDMEKLCATYLWQVQHIEDAVHESVRVWKLNNATGWRLAVIGDLVGQPRIGATDDIYRNYIKTRILVNSSDGRHETLNKIASILIPGFSCYELNDVRFYEIANPDLTYSELVVARGLLKETSACRIEVHWVPDEMAFEFSSASGTEIDAPGGFDDSLGTINAGTFATTPGL